jgi:hypothetical protein
MKDFTKDHQRVGETKLFDGFFKKLKPDYEPEAMCLCTYRNEYDKYAYYFNVANTNEFRSGQLFVNPNDDEIRYKIEAYISSTKAYKTRYQPNDKLDFAYKMNFSRSNLPVIFNQTNYTLSKYYTYNVRFTKMMYVKIHRPKDGVEMRVFINPDLQYNSIDSISNKLLDLLVEYDVKYPYYRRSKDNAYYNTCFYLRTFTQDLLSPEFFRLKDGIRVSESGNYHNSSIEIPVNEKDILAIMRKDRYDIDENAGLKEARRDFTKLLSDSILIDYLPYPQDLFEKHGDPDFLIDLELMTKGNKFEIDIYRKEDILQPSQEEELLEQFFSL